MSLYRVGDGNGGVGGGGDDDDDTTASLGDGFLNDEDAEAEAGRKWDESLTKLRYTMVAFELFDKSQMKRFFGTVWALIGVAVVYVVVFLSHAAVCSANATFPEAFEKYVAAECSRNGTIPGNFSAPEFWKFCCAPFDGVGNAGGPGACFDLPHVDQGYQREAHPPPTYLGCCHVDLEGALDVCDTHCQFNLVDAVARTLLGTASVVGLFIYGARFCISPNMRRFEQKFVLGLFFLCVLMTNPVSAGFQLTQRYNIQVFGSCDVARYETPTADQKVCVPRVYRGCFACFVQWLEVFYPALCSRLSMRSVGIFSRSAAPFLRPQRLDLASFF
eukprot:INCI17603.18.p2 GENE.INCI17603.18~~INCI17603.18.p2  ORF type:complete len:331 (-),score=47.56 INCI17603.18:1477-2469(-)